MTPRCLLLAGSVGPERVPARPDPQDADWYLPLHLREPAGARERIAAQVSAGADIVVAPTWLTHRRALLPIGETRRAGEWTSAASRLAREAVEQGLERRDAVLADAPDDDVRRGRPEPLVAGVLPALDDDPDEVAGRILPTEAATERDYRDQAGYLADAEPDLLLVAGQRNAASARSAIGEAVQTGLPTWATLGVGALREDDPQAWLVWAAGVGLERLLVPPPLDARLVFADAAVGWGAYGVAADSVGGWLAAGAGAITLLDGAAGDALDAMREAIDEVEREALQAQRAAEKRWLTHVAAAASMATGGTAAWIGDAPGATLPDGFEWLVVPASAAGQLPEDHFSLVVIAATTAAHLGRTLRRGGILATRADPGATAGARATGLSIISVDDAGAPLLTYRREG